MKSFAISAALLAGSAAAFPHLSRRTMDDMTAPLRRDAEVRSISEMKRQVNPIAPQGLGALPAAPPPFDAKAQLVDVSGTHAFVAPGPLDQRGMCPGLNALANHGYLPHNGVATIQQFVDATQTGFGMSPDLGLFLAVYGAVVDGTLTQWSIGGVPHTGIAGSHGNYEADSSPNHADINQYGDERLVISQFKELYNMQANAVQPNYNLEVLRDFRNTRLQESIQKNPYFFYGPFAGDIVTQAAYTFIYRFMANKSAQYPEGVLNKEVLKSFFSVSGPDNNLTWTPGHERIPNNWYKRNPTDEYSILYFESDIGYFTQKYPQIQQIGCNQGRVNSFNAFDYETLSNGAYTLNQALSNPLCFGTEFIMAEAPGFTGLSTAQLAPLFSVFTNLTSQLNCPAIGSVNTTAFEICPGASLYGGPTAVVAPGAIQN